jgi:hypothetical protein
MNNVLHGTNAGDAVGSLGLQDVVLNEFSRLFCQAAKRRLTIIMRRVYISADFTLFDGERSPTRNALLLGFAVLGTVISTGDLGQMRSAGIPKLECRLGFR